MQSSLILTLNVSTLRMLPVHTSIMTLADVVFLPNYHTVKNFQQQSYVDSRDMDETAEHAPVASVYI